MSKKRTPETKAMQQAAVLTGIHEGASMRKACIAAGVPAATFVSWVEKDPVLAEQYACAREVMLDKMADDLLEISDEAVPSTANGGLDSAAVAKQRLQVDTRKWLLSKLAPKKYGERQTLEHEGGVSLTVVTGVDV